MARDPRSRRGADGDAHDDVHGDDPTQQLDRLRAGRDAGGDTQQFPAVPADPVHEPPARRRVRRPGAGVLVGLGVLAIALVLSGLSALGVGPVRSLLGSDDTPDASPSTSAPSTESSAGASSSAAAPSTSAPSAPSTSGPATSAPSAAAPGPGASDAPKPPGPSGAPQPPHGSGAPKPPKAGGSGPAKAPAPPQPPGGGTAPGTP